MMNEDMITEWIMNRLNQKKTIKAEDLVREFFKERKITRTNDPVFQRFMSVSMRLADEIALRS